MVLFFLLQISCAEVFHPMAKVEKLSTVQLKVVYKKLNGKLVIPAFSLLYFFCKVNALTSNFPHGSFPVSS